MGVPEIILIKRLRERVKLLVQEINILENQISDYYSNKPMQVMEIVEILTKSYSTHLNPAPLKLTASSKNKSQTYWVKPEEIICVKSSGRTKTIYTLNKLNEIGNDLESKDTISLESNWESLLQRINPLNFHLCAAKKGVYVNVKFYNLIDGNLICKLPEVAKFKGIEAFELGIKERERFIESKGIYLEVSKLHNMLIRYKFKN